MRGKTKWSFDGKLCQKYSYQKLSKSDNWFSSYSRKCQGCFLGHSVGYLQYILSLRCSPLTAFFFSLLFTSPELPPSDSSAPAHNQQLMYHKKTVSHTRQLILKYVKLTSILLIMYELYQFRKLFFTVPKVLKR